MRIKLPRARAGSKGFQRPFIRVLVVAQNVYVAVISLDAKIQGLRTIPLIVDRFDEALCIPKPKLDWALISLMASVTFHS
jgi:hypothetical protein